MSLKEVEKKVIERTAEKELVGNPGSQSGVARPGIQENQKLPDTRFRGYDGRAPADLFCQL